MKASHRLTRAHEKVKVLCLNASEQARRVQQTIARRAYETFERRGGAAWHELEDWRKAESEILLPCCCGEMTLYGNLWLGTDASVFEAGTMEVWIAPRLLTICGKPSIEKVHTPSGEPRPELVYHVVDLPLEVDPSGVTTRFHGPSLDIVMRKARPKPAPEMCAAV